MTQITLNLSFVTYVDGDVAASSSLLLLTSASGFLESSSDIIPVSRVRQSKRLTITSLPIIQLKLLEHGVFKLGICRRNIRLSVK